MLDEEFVYYFIHASMSLISNLSLTKFNGQNIVYTAIVCMRSEPNVAETINVLRR